MRRRSKFYQEPAPYSPTIAEKNARDGDATPFTFQAKANEEEMKFPECLNDHEAPRNRLLDIIDIVRKDEGIDVNSYHFMISPAAKENAVKNTPHMLENISPHFMGGGPSQLQLLKMPSQPSNGMAVGRSLLSVASIKGK